jgi:class 3 adenylate cyclase
MRDCLVSNPDERPTSEELDKRLKRVDVKVAEPAAQISSHLNKTTISLFDIFPKHIAEALQDGKQIEPEHRESVTIFFSDIVGFTDISSMLDPRKVANMLDRLYQKFDDLSHTHDIFKVRLSCDAVQFAIFECQRFATRQSSTATKRLTELCILSC